MVTIKDVAQKAGVSIAAVSYALNGKQGVNEETKRRILMAAEQLGYVPDSMAKGLATRRSSVIGVIAPDISNLYISTFIKYLEEAARLRDYFLLIGSAQPPHEEATVKRLLSNRMDGMILTPANSGLEKIYQKIAHITAKRNVPLILANIAFPGIDCNYVVPALEQGEYRMTKHLLAKGCKRLIYVGGALDNYYNGSRYAGFMRALRESGTQEEEPHYVCCGTRCDYAEGYQTADAYLQQHTLPDAFVAVNDMVAYGLIQRLSEKGIHVPQDVCVTGFDNISLPTVQTKKLTTMEIPLDQMARLCVDAIADQTNIKTEIETILVSGETA